MDHIGAQLKNVDRNIRLRNADAARAMGNQVRRELTTPPTGATNELSERGKV